ncbi:hypothetical protein DQ239_04785 [Blastococcus sp. TF02-09]|uniref:hypothetical protein n=1 Tax=Blastococcus sp. TF02-09 TaxID=2250576 RepID=UPI000DE9030E|nr:hypothetical protein [Blastococcus sp. TF02-9]RBY80367.1 hypothetical protein DQ239_04785 [Blastococcus sp. TF02-9]
MSGSPSPVTVEATTADAVAAAVLRCPAVAALHPGGLLHRTVTYLPGRRVDGVRVDDDRIAVSVVGRQGIPVVLLADQVRSAVAPLAGGRRVDVHVADLQRLAEEPPALPPAAPA